VSSGVQLRRYQLLDGAMETFVSVFTDQLVPLRKRFGFEVVGAWVLRESNEFVWIVRHPDDFVAAEAAYYAAPERAAVRPAPGTLLERSASWMMSNCME
jgi:hypothetical protein